MGYEDEDVIYFNGEVDKYTYLSTFDVNDELRQFAKTVLQIMKFNKEDDFSDYFINMEDDELEISKGEFEFYHTVKVFDNSEYIQMVFRNIDENRELELSYRHNLYEEAMEVLDDYLLEE